jgi:hypothetical protein
MRADATLFLARGRHGMSAARVNRLLKWVENGGHLIVGAEPAHDPDPLLDALGIARREAQTPSGLAQITLPGAGRALQVAMPAMGLVDAKRRRAYVAKHGAGTAMLHFEMGDGEVTVLPSFGFMTNTAIGEHDHAAFAWALVRLAPATPVVLVAPRFEAPSLAKWLVTDARAALGAGAVLLVLWLVRISTRFGPVQPPATPERRRLLDHLRASGRFVWATPAASRLLEAAREGCLAKIARTRHGLAGLTAAERTARFSELTAIPAAEIDQAFNAEALNPRAFTHAVRTLQQIEETLTR